MASYKLQLQSLFCEWTEDDTGADEPYILVNGSRVWGNASLNNKQSANINTTITASGTSTIVLFDADSGILDEDDRLGVVTVSESQIGKGQQTGKFTREGANYTLYYTVKPVQKYYNLQLQSLFCEWTEDDTGGDEPYILVNGSRVWGNASLNNKQSANINVTITASGNTTIMLFDEDTGFFDEDDKLGVVTVSESQIGKGQQTGKFTGEGANYTLYYTVK